MESSLRLKSGKGRWVLAATILGSSMAALDATVVSIALPRIGAELGGGFSVLQWTVNAYTLTLAAFLLLGGSLGDRFGRRRVFVVGVGWFAIASVGCALAPSAALLIAFRSLEGVGAAMLTPGSLSILEATFREEDRAGAIGAWAAFAGIATAIGPVVGGWLIQSVSWRLIFLINIPLALATIWMALRHVPETKDRNAPRGLDVTGTVFAAAGLAGLLLALIEGPTLGWSAPLVLVGGSIGVMALGAFFRVETKSEHPILPLNLFTSTQFSAANGVTFLVYGGLGGALFLVPIVLQQVMHYSPTQAGLSLLPLTIVMLALSTRMGNLATRIGPRIPMTVGPLLGAIGFALLSQVKGTSSYLTHIFPGVTLLAVGLAITVAPLTATVLAAVPAQHSGVASAVNTDIARIAQLLAVAVLPVVSGITSASYSKPASLADGFGRAMWVAAGALAFGSVLAAALIRRSLVTVIPSSLASCPISAPPVARLAA